MNRVTCFLIAILSSVPLLQGQNLDNDKDVSKWRTRTQPKFAADERVGAIVELETIAFRRIKDAKSQDRLDDGVAWVATEVLPTLLKLLDDKNPDVRGRAAGTFCSFRGYPRIIKPALPRLIELLRDPNFYVRNWAVGVFKSLGSPAETAVPDLIRIIKEDKDPGTRADAAEALATTSPKARLLLVGLLDDKHVESRRAVVKVFGGYYEDDSVAGDLKKAAPKLKQLLNDEDAEVRQGAIVAVRYQVAPPTAAVAAIAPLLHDKDKDVRQTVAIKLLELGPAAKAALPEVMKLAGDSDKRFRKTLTSALPLVGPDSIPVLMKLLDDGDPEIRATAADSLDWLGPAAKAAVPALKRLLTDMHELKEYRGRVCNRAGFALATILGDDKYLKGLPPMPEDGK